MSHAVARRDLLRAAVSGGAFLGMSELAFLTGLPPVSAEEARPDPDGVRLDSGIEPLVRFLESTPRDRLLEEVGARIRSGLSYRELLAALLLAGVRNVQPRPSVGFKFHCVLVVHSAHLASLSSPDADRWLPIFWALDYFKVAQAQEQKSGGWRMGAVREPAVPPARRAPEAFVEAMERWDEGAADGAAAALARTATPQEAFELFCRYGMRDFRSIGHKAIYVANAWRTLACIGWRHAEPVLRSLARALLAHEGENPAAGDARADRPWRRNRELLGKIRDAGGGDHADPAVTADLLAVLREGSDEDAPRKAVEMLNGGASPGALWDALLAGAGELLMRRPGILSLHAVTTMNALRHCRQATGSEETRRLLLLQGAAFLPLFRGDPGGLLKDVRIDRLEPEAPGKEGPPAIEEIFAEVDRDRMSAARKVLAHLAANPSPEPLMDAARVLVFLKGNDAHDYKFSSALLEDYRHISPGWRDRFLAAGVFHLRGSTAPDNALVARARAALKS